MKKILGILAGLALASAVNADVRFFFTSSLDAAGLTDTTHAFNDTDGGQTDGASYLLNDDLPTVGVPTLDLVTNPDAFLYLWLEFEAEPNGRKVQGINLVGNDQGNDADRGIYLGDDTLGDTGSKLRWETSSKTTDPMTLVGVSAPGIVNTNKANNVNFLYNGIKNGRHYALLGAIKPLNEGGEYDIRLGLGKNGVSYANNVAPNVKTGGDEEQWNGAVRDEPDYYWSTAADAHIIAVPEPVSMLLLALAGLALRRR